MTPPNIHEAAHLRESYSESNYSDSSSKSEAATKVPRVGQLEYTSDTAGGPREILQLPNRASLSREHDDTGRKQKKAAHFDDHVLEVDAAIRRIATDPSHLHSSGTGLDLRTTSTERQEHPREDDDDTGDGHAHQRQAIERFYSPTRGHVKERAQNDSECDADDDGDERSVVSIDTASMGGDDCEMDSEVGENIEGRLQLPTGQGCPRTDSLEVYASEGTEIDKIDRRHHQQDETWTESDDKNTGDLPGAYLQLPEAVGADKAGVKGALYALPNITEESLRSQEYQPATDTADESQPSPVETFPAYEEQMCTSSGELDALELARRPSETQSAPAPVDRRGRRMTKTKNHPRHSSSLTEFCRTKGRVRRTSRISTKSSPALPAMTAVSVRKAESARINTVYPHSKSRYIPLPSPKVPIRTAQTIQSDLGVYQMMWEDVPSPNSGDSSGTMLEQSTEDVSSLVYDHNPDQLVAPTLMMENVTSKLTAWTWEKEFGDRTRDDQHGWLPLLNTNEHHHRGFSDQSNSQEIPPGPPNTAQHPGGPSVPDTPDTQPVEEEDDEEDDSDPHVEIRVKSVSANRSKPCTTDHTRATTPTAHLLAPLRSSSLPASPTIPRQLSNLPMDDLQFQSHRDSVEIARGHIKRELLDKYHPERPNRLLLAARDSYSLARRRLAPITPTSEPHGQLQPNIPSIQWSRFGGLSPIPDGSPPRHDVWDNRAQRGRRTSEESLRLSPRSRISSPVGTSREAGHAWPGLVEDGQRSLDALTKRIEHLEERVEILEDCFTRRMSS